MRKNCTIFVKDELSCGYFLGHFQARSREAGAKVVETGEWSSTEQWSVLQWLGSVGLVQGQEESGDG